MAQPLPQTAPRPILRAHRQPGSQRIALEVTADCQEMIVGFYREGLEPVLVHMTRTGTSVGMPALGMIDEPAYLDSAGPSHVRMLAADSDGVKQNRQTKRFLTRS